MPESIDREQRARGAVLAQFVGDALCLGSHWYYNLADRRRIYPGGIEGFEAPVDGHYHAGREPGDPTHYGDAAMVLLRSVAETGRADPVDYGRRFVALFAPETYRGYLDKPTRLTVQAFRDAGGDAERFPFQRGADGPVPEALALRYEDAKAMRGMPVVDVTGEFGRSCYLPSTFPSLMHAALKHGHDLPTALLECCRAGGDNASRCAVLGAWLGAVHGVDAIPAPWRQRLKAAPEVEALAGRLVSAG